MQLADHPTVSAYKEGRIAQPEPQAILQAEQLKKMTLAVQAIARVVLVYT